jgi:hypothetical protein
VSEDHRRLLEAFEPVAKALGAEIVAPASLQPGDIDLVWDDVVVGGFRQPGLNGALDRLLDGLSDEYGCDLSDLPRETKQQVVSRLDSHGAFVIRRAVEDVADRLGVSRFTVYNYLNALEGSGPADRETK